MNKIVMLCNNSVFLDFFMKKSDIKNYDFSIMTDNRTQMIIPDVWKERNILAYYAAGVLKNVIKRFNLPDNDFINNYIFTPKFLIPLWFLNYGRDKKVLYIDDDVIMPGNVEEIFKYNFGICNEVKCGMKREEFEAFKEIFNMEMSYEFAMKQKIHAGIMLLSRDDMYPIYVKRFFEHPYFVKLWNEHKHEEKNIDLHFSEQRFHGMYFKNRTYKVLNDKVKLLLDRFEDKKIKVFERKKDKYSIVHFSGGRKEKFKYIEYLDTVYPDKHEIIDCNTPNLLKGHKTNHGRHARWSKDEQQV